MLITPVAMGVVVGTLVHQYLRRRKRRVWICMHHCPHVWRSFYTKEEAVAYARTAEGIQIIIKANLNDIVIVEESDKHA